MKTINMAGLIINGITVIERAGSISGKAEWVCLCACGSIFNAVGVSLRNGRTKGCKSCAKLNSIAAATKHGLCRSREYNSYNAMKSRCYNPLDKRYSRYGGRGISVCARWLESFENFFLDMGMQPSSSHSIERKNVDGNYEPSNCVWATVYDQANNRSNNTLIEIDSRTQTLTQWSRETGINRTVISRRIRRGLTGSQLIYKGIIR